MDLRCPRCSAVLVDDGGCPSCGGAWIAAQWVKEHVWPKMTERAGEALRCPVCSADTRPVVLEGVAVDCCGQGDGVWFDEGELRIALDRGEAHRASVPAAAPDVMEHRHPILDFFASLLSRG